MTEQEPKGYDRKKPWFQNIGCDIRLELEEDSLRGVLKRIDVIEYRKYIVIETNGPTGVRQRSVNIDHILMVEEVRPPFGPETKEN